MQSVGVDRAGAGGEAGPSGLALTSFTARSGEIVAITGATGSGKTSLLRALLGLEPAAVGSVRYGDEELGNAGVGPSERPFAWVPQDAPMLDGTLEDNLLLGASERRSSAEVLGLLGAGSLAGLLGDEGLGASGRPVSGGERKWVALARAVASGLPVLLLDEPTAGLDRASARAVLQGLERLRGSRTIILVSHEAEPVAIADQVVRLGAKGALVELGPPPARGDLAQN